MPTINDTSGLNMNYSLVGGGGASAGGSSGALLSGSQAAGIGSAIGAFGTAAGDFMSIGSDKQSAAAYGEAASLAGENILITETATTIQAEQAQRQLAKTLGQQSAAIAGNGFEQGSGSGAAIYRASVEQGALAQSLITSQGAVTENSYRSQQQADLQQQAQANAKAKSDMFGGFLSAAEGAIMVAAIL